MKYILIKSKKHGDVKINLTEAMINKKIRLSEGMDKESLSDVQKLIDKTIPKKIEDAVKKAMASSATEDKIVEIVKNCMVQLFKALWVKKSAWKGAIKNDSN